MIELHWDKLSQSPVSPVLSIRGTQVLDNVGEWTMHLGYDLRTSRSSRSAGHCTGSFKPTEVYVFGVNKNSEESAPVTQCYVTSTFLT